MNRTPAFGDSLAATGGASGNHKTCDSSLSALLHQPFHYPKMSQDSTEVKQTGAYLLAASKQIGKFCDDVNDQFIICKAENANPAFCVEPGKRVTACAMSVYVTWNTVEQPQRHFS